MKSKLKFCIGVENFKCEKLNVRVHAYRDKFVTNSFPSQCTLFHKPLEVL